MKLEVGNITMHINRNTRQILSVYLRGTLWSGIRPPQMVDILTCLFFIFPVISVSARYHRRNENAGALHRVNSLGVGSSFLCPPNTPRRFLKALPIKDTPTCKSCFLVSLPLKVATPKVALGNNDDVFVETIIICWFTCAYTTTPNTTICPCLSLFWTLDVAWDCMPEFEFESKSHNWDCLWGPFYFPNFVISQGAIIHKLM